MKALPVPAATSQALLSFARELGGKRLELLKEAVPKLARVAVLYNPAASSPVHEVKEVLPVAARALGLTVRSSEVRDANGFEKVFAALNKERPDGLYVTGGALMNANEKRTIGFALKSRLPSVYGRREAVDDGGLMSYGADRGLSGASLFRGQNLKGRQTGRFAGGAADEVRIGDQSQGGETDGTENSAGVSREREQGDQIAVRGKA